MFTLGRKSDNMSIPMWIPHGVLALGFGLMALIVLWHGIQFVRGEKPGDSGSRTDEEVTNS
jgi:TRAP-type C4-dicarboxylate transport system permease small subunit